jgi:dipeptidyl aminopeptidase/acylaminoacyl peptidase
LGAIPQLEYSGSYETLITNLRWTPGSKSIFFLGQNSHGKRQLYEADVNSGAVDALTPEDHDVVRFEFAGSNIVYMAVPPSERRTAGEAINSDSRDVTGMALTSIVFPGMANHHDPSELWVVSKGKNRRVKDPNTGQPVRMPKFPPAPYSVLSLSSDGQAAVVLVPSKTIPLLWELYEPTFAYLKLHSNDTDAAANSWPAEYAAVDLDSGKTEVLVNAPNAWDLGSADMNQAVWASDSKKLLLTNTYLPLESVGKTERSKRLHYCVAAIVELASKEGSCVVFSTYDRAKKILTAGSFGESNKEVVLRFWNAPNKTTEERYQYENGAWQSAAPPRYQDSHGPNPVHSKVEPTDFYLAIKQDLNTPPALWATDRKTGRSKKVWDPNPQLAVFNLGEASEFHWKDKTGHEWIGGLVKPPDYVPGKRYPVVIQTHGFQENDFITDGAYTTAFAARPLASAGIVVLQMPRRQDRLVTGDEASDEIEGFESAIERLAADGMIDPEKVGIIGFSRTCYHVESALIRDPKRFAAATIADGMDASYMQYLLFSVGRSADEEPQIYGGKPFGEGLKKWTENAPGFHLDRIQTPLRIEAITPASILAEWEIYASLWKQAKPVDLIYFPNGQHILQKPAERLGSQQGNVDWFRFWLKGEEDADPAKAKQYTLWRQLRNQSLSENRHP